MSLIEAYKKRAKKAKLTKKLRRELAELEPSEGNHQAFCTTCGMFNVSRKNEAGDQRVYSCSLGVFQSFESSEITLDHIERAGYITEGGAIKSALGDALWFWNEESDKALAFSDFLRIARIIGSESDSWMSDVEENFSKLEYIWDDVLWIEHISRREGLDSITDLDAAIEERRDSLVKRLQRRYAKMFPAYSDLFMQVSASNGYIEKAVVEMALEEVGEKAHKVSMNAFLNNNVLSACGLGFKVQKTDDGAYKNYLHRGYPMPENFGIDVVALKSKPHGRK
jgi:hypothetical protein